MIITKLGRRLVTIMTAVAAAALAVPSTLPAAYAADAPVPGGTVYSVRLLPTGERETTIHTPAPGVSATTLAASLRAAGVSNVTVRQETVAPAATCSHGTARTWGCPMPKWADGPFTRPHVAYINHASATWGSGRVDSA